MIDLEPTFLTYANEIYIDDGMFEFIFKEVDYYLEIGINFTHVSVYRLWGGDELLWDGTIDRFTETSRMDILIDELKDVGIIK